MMRKITLLTAALALACCGAGTADALSQTHAKHFRHPSLGPPDDVAHAPMNAQMTSQWNGYVDYRRVGLSGDPDDCNKGCAASGGP